MAYQKIVILDAQGNLVGPSIDFGGDTEKTVTIAYQSDEANLSGVGVAFNFDASGLSVVSVDNVYTGAVASGYQSGEGNDQELAFGWASLFGQFPGSATGDADSSSTNYSDALTLATVTLEKVGDDTDVFLDFTSSAAGVETINLNPEPAVPLEINEIAITENSGEGQVIATVENGDEGATYSLVDNTVYSGDDGSASSEPFAPDQQPNTQHVYISDSQFSDDGSQLTVTLAYMSDEANLSGVGISVDFDSSVLSVNSIDNVFAGAVASGYQSGDGDDQSLAFGWASVFGQFPGANSADLATITFDVIDPSVGSTHLGISTTSNAAGFAIDVQGITVQMPVVSPLSIDPATGEVTLSANPDFESVPEYDFVIVDDSGRTGSATVSITNADEQPAVFDNPTATNTVAEDADVIFTAQANDSADISAGVTYSLSGDDASLLSINSAGEVTVNGGADFETKTSYSFTVNVNDGINDPVAESSQDVTVNISNVDDSAPIFDSAGEVSVAENSGANQVVYIAAAQDNASDVTSGPITYSLVDDANGEFTIDADGNVTLATNPDYETQSSYSFTVRATDGNNNSTDQTVTLAITNIVVEKPIFDETIPDPVLDENTEFAYTAVASVDSQAADQGIGEVLVYSLSDDANGVFVIDSASGAVSMTVAVDYEQASDYSFTVVATDDAGNYSEKTVSVTINNLDDYAPTFDPSSVVLDPITENTGAGQVVYTAQADDSGDISGGVSYGFDAYPATTTQAPTPDDNTQHIYISETTRSADGSQLTAVVSYNSSVADTTGLGLRIHFDSSVMTLSALSDALGDDIIFVSNQATADTDDKDNNPVTDSFVDAAWASVLGDWPDENLPTNLMTLTFDVNDRTAASTVLGVSAIDSPQGFEFDGQGITVPLAALTTMGSLTIDPVSGEVVLEDNPDYEETSEYNFSVIATDAAGNQSDPQSVNLVINDEQLAITSSATAAAVDENIDAGSVVYSTSVSGAEAQDTITYSLLTNLSVEQGGIEQRFVENQDGSITLQLFVSPSLLTNYPNSIENFDLVIGYDDLSITQQSVTVASEAQLQIVEETVVGEVKIAGIFLDQLPNISDNPIVEMVFTLNQDVASAEFSVTDVLIGTDHNPLQDSISRYYDSRGFAIDSVTGDVSLIDSPDHESKSEYIFSVMATDEARAQSDIQTVTLAINDVDDAAPTIDFVGSDDSGAPTEPSPPDDGTGSDGQFTIVENSGAGQQILTATASDTADISDGVSFSLAGADASSFAINATTGVVTLTGNPDYESKSSYNFIVVATDAAGNSVQKEATVTVTNVDDSAPVITSGSYAGIIDENTGANQIIYIAVADDTNDISDSPVTFSLSNDSDPAISIDANTGEVKLLDDPDFEAQAQYVFTVLATDNAGNVSDGQTVTIDIDNFDEVAPEITSDVVANSVVENGPPDQHVYTVTATDHHDISDGVSYSLADDADGNFSIDVDGKVTFTGTADYEQQSSYSFSVVATDAAGNSSQPHIVTMQVENIDETGPSITSSDTADAIDENSGANQIVYTATAEDTDFNGQEEIVFSLDPSSDSVFSINAQTGAVTFAVDPDFEQQDQYSFTVIATDGSGNQSESKTVSLSINDLDDFSLSGNVYHWATQSLMDDVSVSMHHKESGQHIDTVSSNAAGEFVIDELAADDVVVTVDRELQSEDTGRLVTSLDALAALKIAVGINPNALDSSGINQIDVSAYQFFAADVNKSGKVTSADALEILRMAVRTPDAIEREWMFIDESEDFWDETANDGQGALTIDRLSVNLDTDGSDMTIEEASDKNFVGVLLGDVYSSWQAPEGSHSMDYSHFVNLENAGKAPMYQFGMSPQAVPFEINSGETAASIDENSGASQQVYATTSNEAGATYALSNYGDSDQFEIDSTTGVVVLKENPDFEIRQSYSFEVIATNVDGYVDSQTVTLAVNNLDLVAPTITSGDSANAIDENSGAGQVVYVASADDSADISGGVSFSLAVGTDAALSINASTGEVTLASNPDADTKSQYNFTVIATDTAGNVAEQAVSLDINNLDDTAPTITSADAADSIDENTGAGQVIYTVTADDSADVSDGVTYSLVDNSVVESEINIPQIAANTQHIYVSESTRSNDGSQETVVISYNADADNLTGLGLQIHFDSDVLSVEELSDVLADSNIFAYGDPITDDADADGDASTDMYLSIGWAAIFGGWPGALPKDLATVTFNILDQDVASSAINLVSTSSSAGYTFDGQSHDIAIATGVSSLSIDSDTGVVTLDENPDYETQSSYSFDVIATDAAGNASQAQTVTLEVNQPSPIITSADIDVVVQGGGSDQVVYTATSNIVNATYSLVDNTNYSVVSDNSGDEDSQPAETVITVPEVQANTQHVYVSDSQMSEDGSQVTVTFSYLADSDSLSGVGMSVNFDSSVLSVNNVSNVLSGAIASGTQSADANDSDSDSSTDQLLSFGWASLFGGWPGSTSTELATVTFDIADGATGSTGLNLVRTSSQAGYNFDGQSQDLVISAEAADNSSDSVAVSSQLTIDSPSGAVTLAGEADYQSVSNYMFTVTATNGADSASQDVGLVVADALVTSDSYQGTDDADIIALGLGSADVASGSGEDVFAIAQSVDEWGASAHTLTDFDSSADTIDVSAALLAAGYTGLSSAEGVEENQLNQMTNVSADVLDLISSNDSSLDNAFGSYFDDATNVLTIFADSDSSAGSSSIESIEISVAEDSTVEEDDLTLAAFIA